MNILRKARDYRVMKKRRDSMNWIEISRKAIVNNYMLHHQRRPGDMIIPVIKSNAYGHGLKQICEILDTIDECEMVAVDSYPEYLTVYHHCDKQILLIGETEGQNYRYFDPKRTIVGIYNLSTLQTIINLSKPYRIHLFLNTGMNREGIQIADLPRVLDLLRTPHRLAVDGVMSHLAAADDHDGQDSIQSQVDQFKAMYDMIESAGFHPRLRHINNSSGFIKNTDHWFNAHRIGKGLYGFCEYSNMAEYEAFAHKLQVGVDVYSTVTAIQHLAEGEGVGYSYSWTAPEDTTVAVIPFGYYEGLTRRMTNQRSVIHRDTVRPMVGNISMNLSTFHDPSAMVQIGDTIKVVSSDPADANSRWEMARVNDTITREILVKMNNLIKRVVVR